MSSDRDRIVDALGAIARALDTRDFEGLRASFTDDTHAYGARGIEAAIEQMRRHLGGVGPTQHLLGSYLVEIEGDTARSLTYGRVLHVGAGPMKGATYECFGEYDDRWVRVEGQWRISRRWFAIEHEIGDRAVLRPAD